MFDAIDVSASGLAAQRTRMDVISQNVANSLTTHDSSGRPIPYQRKFATLLDGRTADGKAGVRVGEVKSDPSPFVLKKEPGHPDANADGYVAYPNVDMTVEMVNGIEAQRAYEANANMIEVTKSMMNATLRIIA